MKNKNILFVGIIFLSVLIFLSEIIFTNKTFFQRDIILQFKPWKTFINECFKKIDSSEYLESLPIWNPYNHCGMPFIANIQAQIFYPISLVFYIIKDFTVAFKIFITIHLFLAGLFMFLMLKNKNLSTISSLIGGMIWSFNGYIISRIEFLSVFASIVWIPLIIFLIDKLPNNFSLKHTILLSFAIALQFLAGHTQIWMYALLFCFFYSIFLSFSNKNIKIFFMFITSSIFSLLLSAIQFLPTLEFIFLSTRSGGGIKNFGMSFEESSKYSLKLLDIINLFYPFSWQIDFIKTLPTKESHQILYLPNYWIYTFYVGVTTSVLTFIGFFSKKYLKEKIFLSCIFLLFFLYALGKNSLFFIFLYKILPIIRIFRYPATSCYILVFVVCILASYGAEFILKIQKLNLNKYLIFIPLLIFLELKLYSKKIMLTLPSKILYEKKEITNFLLNSNDISLYRFALTPKTQILSRTVSAEDLYNAIATYRDNLLGNINLDYFIYNFRGQDIELKNFFEFLNIVYSEKSLDEALPFFSISNVKYILSSESQPTKYCNLIFNRKYMKIYENPFAKERIYFVNEYLSEKDLKKSIQLIKKIKDKLTHCIIIHSNEKFNIDFKPKKIYYSIKYLDFRHNKVSLEIENNADGFLVMSQNFYPGWKCYINGRSGKIYHCNIYMMCVYLKKGYNQVIFQFEPLSFKIGSILSLVSTLIFLLYLFEKGG